MVLCVMALSIVWSGISVVDCRLFSHHKQEIQSHIINDNDNDNNINDSNQLRTRIVGGKEVQDSDQYPYFVNLGGCSGSLIHGDIVLTAAHVSQNVTKEEEDGYLFWCSIQFISHAFSLICTFCPRQCSLPIGATVQVGARIRGSTRDGSVKVKVIDAVRHPDYDDYSHEYDFRVLQLGAWMQDRLIIALNNNSAVPQIEQELTLTGMGRTEEGGNISSVLRETTLFAIDHESCQALNPEYLVNDDVVLCASGEERDR